MPRLPRLSIVEYTLTQTNLTMQCLFQIICSQAFGEIGEEKVILDHELGLDYKIISVENKISCCSVFRTVPGTIKYLI